MVPLMLVLTFYCADTPLSWCLTGFTRARRTLTEATVLMISTIHFTSLSLVVFACVCVCECEAGAYAL